MRVQSQFIGVSNIGNRWMVRLNVDGRQTILDRVQSEQMAAQLYDAAACLLSAWIKFPNRRNFHGSVVSTDKEAAKAFIESNGSANNRTLGLLAQLESRGEVRETPADSPDSVAAQLAALTQRVSELETKLATLATSVPNPDWVSVGLQTIRGQRRPSVSWQPPE